ncbi:MAG: hypothetical protein SPL47_01835 [Bacteroidales bacterium]|nr:hypothetical protein [Bacteroidales bacterium]
MSVFLQNDFFQVGLRIITSARGYGRPRHSRSSPSGLKGSVANAVSHAQVSQVVGLRARKREQMALACYNEHGCLWVCQTRDLPRTPDGVRLHERPSIPTVPGRPDGLPALPDGR